MKKEFDEILEKLSLDTMFLIKILKEVDNNDVYTSLQNQRFTAKDLDGITYRTINYWNEQGFLIGHRDRSEGWRKFNFIELIWIRVLDKLRELGVSLDKTIPIIFKYLGYIPLTDDIKKQLEKFSKEERHSHYRIVGNYTQLQSNFTNYVLYVIFLKTTIIFRIYTKGQVEIWKGDNSNITQKDILLEVQKISKSFISINLNEIVAEYIANEGRNEIIENDVLNDNEKELLKYIRNKEVKEIYIKLNNGEPVYLEITETEQPNIGKRVSEFLLSPYENISFKTNGGKQVSFERTTKIKLKK